MDIRGRMKPNVEFSTAPIADIVFLLLIYFILTSSFVVTSSLEVELPDGSAKNPKGAANTITITTDLQYAWNEKTVTKEDLPALIEEVLTDDDEENDAIACRLDKSVPVEELTFVMSKAKEHGGKVIIMTKK